MSAIRPPAASPLAQTQVRDARAAFFKTVVEAPAPAARREPQAAPPKTERVEVRPVAQAAPDRILPPGSLLNIRV